MYGRRKRSFLAGGKTRVCKVPAVVACLFGLRDIRVPRTGWLQWGVERE